MAESVYVHPVEAVVVVSADRVVGRLTSGDATSVWSVTDTE